MKSKIHEHTTKKTILSVRKKFIKILFSLGLVLLFNASSCNKPEPEPENPLPTGENTMYYYLDGTLVIPNTYNNGGIVTDAIGYGICLPINNNTTLSTSRGLYISFLGGINSMGIIILNQSNYDMCMVNDNHAMFSQSELWNDGIFHTTPYYTQSHTGEVNITYLSPNKRQFKGTFWMDLYRLIIPQ